MPHRFTRLASLGTILSGLLVSGAVHAASDHVRAVDVPYFASLKRSVSNVRVGPGRTYPIRWVYRKRGLPVEILASYGNWRRIRTSDGGEGWISAALLSLRRSALVDPWSKVPVDLRAARNGHSGIVARLQARVLVGLQWCDLTWCSVRLPGRDVVGYVSQTRLWGVYPDEVIPDRSVWGAVRHLL